MRFFKKLRYCQIFRSQRDFKLSFLFRYFRFYSDIFVFIQIFLFLFKYFCFYSDIFVFIQIFSFLFRYFCFYSDIFVFIQIFQLKMNPKICMSKKSGFSSLSKYLRNELKKENHWHPFWRVVTLLKCLTFLRLNRLEDNGVK